MKITGFLIGDDLPSKIATIVRQTHWCFRILFFDFSYTKIAQKVAFQLSKQQTKYSKL